MDSNMKGVTVPSVSHRRSKKDLNVMEVSTDEEESEEQAGGEQHGPSDNVAVEVEAEQPGSSQPRDSLPPSPEEKEDVYTPHQEDSFYDFTTEIPFSTRIPSTNISYSIDNCSEDAAFPSFTLVMDTTGSMGYDLYQFQNIARYLATRLEASSANVTRKYILMEFNDPSVGPLYVTCSSTEFFNNLYSLYPHEGGDCPEYAMSGLLTALQYSPYGSFVLLVTDASAKDSDYTDTVNQIYSLIDSLQVKKDSPTLATLVLTERVAQVFFFAGSCFGTDQPDYKIYKDIAYHSYGLVFPINYLSSKAADLVNFFLKIPVNSTTRLFSVDNDNTIYNATFSVPAGLNSLIISISGSTSSFTLYDPSVTVDWGETFNSSAFCATCDSNASCRKDLLDYTCVCNEGFSGDGFSCYDIDECSSYGYYSSGKCGSHGYCVNTYGSYYCNCYTGYTWDNATCVDVDECSSPSLNNCDPAATCVNYYGSYSCYCPEGYYGNGYKCEVDECTRDVCGFGRECTKFTGYHNCTDPCFTYTTLNDPTRSTSYYDYYYYYYYYYGRSDYYLSGWYRFVGSGGDRLADFCPSVGSCYTRYPMWMNGTHPDPSDGIVNRTVCANYYGYCCYWTSDVKIKACPGGFYVYKFSTPPEYYSGYCTDPSTVSDSCACGENEECRKVGDHYRCYCKDEDLTINDISPVISCSSQEMKASFNKCALEKFSLNTTNIHLKDSYCTGFNDFNLTNLISVVSVLKTGICGNELENNGTHAIYMNTLYLSKNTGESLGADDQLTFDFACVYPLDIEVSLDTALKPFKNSTIIVPGNLEVTMALYTDSTYTSPYQGSAVILTSQTNLFVGILLKLADVSQYYVLIKNCYATPSLNSTIKYDIIKDSCPSKQDSSINVIENGGSLHGRFSVKLFGYVKDSDVVYLQCDIHLCNSACAPVILSTSLENDLDKESPNIKNWRFTTFESPIFNAGDSLYMWRSFLISGKRSMDLKGSVFSVCGNTSCSNFPASTFNISGRR
ncbi:uromodulin-like [Bufo gargarizans]|uniref:uromodulin-like n=1 Tax=Bufo gargarizans TaxID=30331 RepID=UPI001CF5F747|nr:uromodulin-like [Bufo gargarizans]